MPPSPKHFLDLDALDAKTLRAMVDTAAAIKKTGKVPKALGVPPGAVLAMIFEKLKGPIKGRTVAWIGDANNVATSWVHAAARFGFTLRIATPAEFAPAWR